MLESVSRGTLLSSSGRAALGLAGAGTVFGARVAAAAAIPPDDDLAYVRLALASELLAIDFYGKALATRHFGTATRDLRQARADERAHAEALTRSLAAAGQAPLAEGDVDFTYPDGSFSSAGSVAKLGLRVERLLLGISLSAAATVQTGALRLLTAQIGASESQHMSIFSALTGGPRIGRPFPPSLSLDQASSMLDTFES